MFYKLIGCEPAQLMSLELSETLVLGSAWSLNRKLVKVDIRIARKE